MKKIYCYFHNDDLDGWASSAVIKKKHPDAEFCGYNYELEFPLVKGYDIVYMVDCSTTSANMKALIDNNKKFIWIDHHAKKILDTYKDLGEEIEGLRDTESKNAACVLTWNYLFPDKEVPGILKYIEDLDIWKWSLPHTDEINTALFIDFKNDRDQLMHLMTFDISDWSELRLRGKLYIKMRKSQIEFLLELMRVKNFHGYKTGVVNTPIHASFVGHEILEQNPDIDIAIIWYNIKDDIKVSLRSREVDVSKIAHIYGGGGHKLASGFTLKTNVKMNLDVYLW